MHICATQTVACAASALGRQAFHLERFRRRDLSAISEPWCTPLAAAPDAEASTATSNVDTDAASVAGLRGLIFRERVNSGTATVEESIAYNFARGLKRKREADNGMAKKDDSSGDGKKE